MSKTIEQLLALAQQIKNETNAKQNTATRVGGSLEDIIDKIEDVITSLATVAANEGTLASLTTTQKGNLVAAINELVTAISARYTKTESDAITGSLNSLATTVKSSLVGAINDLESNKATKAELATIGAEVGELNNAAYMPSASNTTSTYTTLRTEENSDITISGKNTSRRIADTTMSWQDGDKLTKFVCYYASDVTIYIYSSDKELKSTHSLGAMSVGDNDIESKNITLAAGDYVAVLGAAYGNGSGGTKYYDFAANANAPSMYVYLFGFEYKRVTQTSSARGQSVSSFLSTNKSVFEDHQGIKTNIASLTASVQNINNAIVVESDGVVSYTDAETSTSTGITAAGFSRKVVANTTMTWQDGDKLTHFVCYASATVTIKIFGSDRTLKRTYEIGSVTDGTIDITTHDIVLSEGDIVAVENPGYASGANGGVFLDCSTMSTITSNYKYLFDFKYKRRATSSSTIVPIAQYVKEKLENIENPSASTTKKELKILAVGNSFTCDAFAYVPAIFHSIVSDWKLTIGIMFKSGCSLSEHLGYWEANTSVMYFKYNNGQGKWTSSSLSTPSALQSENWDIVCFQQNSNNSSKINTYYPYLDNLIAKVYAAKSGSTKIAWLFPQVNPVGSNGLSSQGFSTTEALWSATANNVKAVCKRSPIEIVFPVGTAIENARKTTLNNIGDWDNNGLAADGSGHLNEGIGVQVAAYAVVQKLLEITGNKNKSIFGNAIRADSTFVSSQNPPYQDGTIQGSTDDNCLIAQRCAILAVNNPFELMVTE